MKTDYLIIGNSHAAIGAIEGIRSVDPLGQILVVSGEDSPAYSRPLISYLVEGRVDEPHMAYRSPDFYEKNDVKTRLGVTAESVDPEKKNVSLSDGETISYDKLLLATGSKPFVPPIKGVENAGFATTFTKLEDAKNLLEFLDEHPSPRAVVLGAGLIGLKAVEALAPHTDDITVLDLADRVMPSVFDKNASAVMEKHLIDKGINLKLGTSIDEVKKETLLLSDKSEIPYDLLILAVGTRPEVSLAEACGIETDRGIVVDEMQRSSKPDVYAAGDCTVTKDVSGGPRRNIAVLPNAYMQGQCAGAAMAGSEIPPEPYFPLNSMGMMGLYLLTAGTYTGDPLIIDDAEGHKQFYIDDDRLAGYIIIGTCQRAGIYTDLIRTKAALSEVPGILEQAGLNFYNTDKRKQILARPH